MRHDSRQWKPAIDQIITEGQSMNRKLWENVRNTKVFYSILNASFTEIKKHTEIFSNEKKNRESYIIPKPFQMAGKQERVMPKCQANFCPFSVLLMFGQHD